MPIEKISCVVVDGHAIDRARIEERASVIMHRADVHGSERELRVKAIDELVDDALLRQAAERLHVSVSSGDVEHAKRSRMSELGLNDAQWAAELDRQGLKEDALLRQYRDVLLRAKMSQVVLERIDVTEADERDAYAVYVHREAFNVDVETILLDATDEKATALAASLVARARSGEDFCKLVATYSAEDWTKAQCGSPGPLPPSTLIPEVSQAITKMNDGDVAGPLRISSKLAVIRLRRRIIPSFEEVRARLHESVVEERKERLYAAWIKEERAHAQIEIR